MYLTFSSNVFNTHHQTSLLVLILCFKVDPFTIPFLFFVQGISFYNEAGFLSTGRKDGEYISTSSASAEALNDEVTQLPRPELCKRYPYMAFDKNDIGLLSKRSGYIDPRKLVTAQIKLAEQNGCEAIDIVVDDIRPTSPNGYEILLADGRRVKSNKVILATGAFTFCRPLLPDNLVPKLCLYPNTVILVWKTSNLLSHKFKFSHGNTSHSFRAFIDSDFSQILCYTG